MNETFIVGQRPRTIYTVKLNNVLVDPPKVMLIVGRPRFELVSVYNVANQPHPITRASVGVYYADVPLLVDGKDWFRRWLSFDANGIPLDSFEGTFIVQKSPADRPLGIQPP